MAPAVQRADCRADADYGARGFGDGQEDKTPVDFVTRTTSRVNSDFLKKEHPAIYQDALRTSESRKLKVSIQPV